MICEKGRVPIFLDFSTNHKRWLLLLLLKSDVIQWKLWRDDVNEVTTPWSENIRRSLTARIGISWTSAEPANSNPPGRVAKERKNEDTLVPEEDE